MSGKAGRSTATVTTAKPAGPGTAGRNSRPKARMPAPGPPPAGAKPDPGREAAKGPAGKAARTSRVVIRRIDPVAVFKVSLLFYVSLCVALFTAGLLLWAGAHAVGLITNIESFMDEIGFTDFRLDGSQLMQGFSVLGVSLIIVGSIANLLMAVLYNLIVDVVGGIKVVLSEDSGPPRR